MILQKPTSFLLGISLIAQIKPTQMKIDAIITLVFHMNECNLGNRLLVAKLLPNTSILVWSDKIYLHHRLKMSATQSK